MPIFVFVYVGYLNYQKSERLSGYKGQRSSAPKVLLVHGQYYKEVFKSRLFSLE
jgi:hypothetical protein